MVQKDKVKFKKSSDTPTVQIIILSLVIPVFALNSFRFIDGFKYWSQSNQIHQNYVTQVEQLKAKRAKLLSYVDRLKNDELAMEAIAREQGYVKEGETVYLIVSSVKDRYTDFHTTGK